MNAKYELNGWKDGEELCREKQDVAVFKTSTYKYHDRMAVEDVLRILIRINVSGDLRKSR